MNEIESKSKGFRDWNNRFDSLGMKLNLKEQFKKQTFQFSSSWEKNKASGDS